MTNEEKVRLLREAKEKGTYLQLYSAINMYLIKHWPVYHINVEPTVDNFFYRYTVSAVKGWYLDYFKHNCLKTH